VWDAVIMDFDGRVYWKNIEHLLLPLLPSPYLGTRGKELKRKLGKIDFVPFFLFSFSKKGIGNPFYMD
jgi:hypothetical protein